MADNKTVPVERTQESQEYTPEEITKALIRSDLERRLQLESVLRKQQELVDFWATSSDELKRPAVDYFSASMEELKRQQEYREDFQKLLDEKLPDTEKLMDKLHREREKNRKSLFRRLSKFSPRGLKEHETSMTARLVGGTMSAGMDATSSVVGKLTEGIPGVKEAGAAIAGATKFVLKAIKETRENKRREATRGEAEQIRREKAGELEKKFIRQRYPEASQASPLPVGMMTPLGGGESKEKIEKERTEQKKARDGQRVEGEKAETRHRGLMKWLQGFSTMLMISRVAGMLFSTVGAIAASIAALVASSGSILSFLTGGLIGKLAQALGGIITSGLDKVVRKAGDLFRGKTTPKPPAPPGPAGGSTKLPSPEKPKQPDVKQNTSTWKKVATSPTVQRGAKALAFLGRGALRLVPGIGTLYMAYEVGSMIEEHTGAISTAKDFVVGKLSSWLGEGESEGMKPTPAPVEFTAPEVMTEGEALPSVQIGSAKAQLAEVEHETKQREIQQMSDSIAHTISNSTISNSFNNTTTNNYPEGFSFASDSNTAGLLTPNLGAMAR